MWILITFLIKKEVIFTQKEKLLAKLVLIP